jgi:hypothetical protein
MRLSQEIKLVYATKKAKEESKARQNIEPILNPYNISKDFGEFLSTCRIRSGVSIVPFKAYDYQLELNRVIDGHPGVMIIKDRQLGITELLGGRMLFKMLHNPAFLTALISISQDKASEVSGRVKEMASALGIEWEKASSKKLKPVGCGESQYLPSTDNAARSLPSITEFNVDEAGFIDTFEELYGAGTSAQEMVPEEHRKTILNTTVPPSGTLSEFWGMFDDANGDIDAIEMVRKAREGETTCNIPGMVWWTDSNGWAKVVLSHRVQAKYNYPGYLEDVCKRRKIPMTIAQREHNLGIETAEGSLFNSEAIARQAIGQWSEPVAGNHYIAMTDPNFGGSDNWVTLIFDVTASPYSLVAEFVESERGTEYCRSKSLELSDRYDVLFHAIESNSGGAVLSENMIVQRPGLKVLLTNTSRTSKIVNTDRIAFALEQGEFIYPADWQGINEFKRFSLKDRAATGASKDDRVMALAAGWAWIEEAVPKIAGGYFSTQKPGDANQHIRRDNFGRSQLRR